MSGYCRWRGRGERKPYGERAAPALAAFNFDRTAMLFDDLPGCGQPDAAAPDPTDGVPRPLEALEHSRQVGRRDADASVLHRQHCLVCSPRTITAISPPFGLYLLALESRLPSTRS